MTEYEVGYKKPPREHQFKKGVCPNPAGRGKRKAIKSDSIGAVTRQLLDEVQEVTQQGRVVWMSRLEVIIRRLVRSAAAGDVGNAAQLLDLLAKAERQEDVGPIIVHIRGGLPAEVANLDPPHLF